MDDGSYCLMTGKIGIEAVDRFLGRLKMDRLLALEKQRRGVRANKLVFLSIANVASYSWCAAQSVLKSREDEAKFFGSYLQDRISYSAELGYIDKLPKTPERILAMGDSITLRNIEDLLHERGKDSLFTGGSILSVEVTDRDGKNVTLLKPDMSDIEKKIGADIVEKDATIGNLEDFPLERGVFLEDSRAEKYPSIRWNFGWKDYTLVGVPDGITDDFVYEFKTTRNRFNLAFMKYGAIAQADLYGHFFGRKKKRIQILILDGDRIETQETRTSSENAEDYLRRFMDADHGGELRPPKTFKCKQCQFAEMCPLGRGLKKPEGTSHRIPFHLPM